MSTMKRREVIESAESGRVADIVAAIAEEATRKSDRDLLVDTRIDVAVLLQHRQFHAGRLSSLEVRVERIEAFRHRVWGAVAVVSALVAAAFQAVLTFLGRR